MQKYSFDKESGGSACQMAPLHLLLHARYIQGSFRRSWEQARTEGGLTRSGKYTGRGVAAAPSSTPARRPFVGEFGWTFHVSLTEDWSRPLSDRPSPGILVRRAGPPRASPSRPPPKVLTRLPVGPGALSLPRHHPLTGHLGGRLDDAIHDLIGCVVRDVRGVIGSHSPGTGGS